MIAHWSKLEAVYGLDYMSEERKWLAENHPHIKLTPKIAIVPASSTNSNTNDEQMEDDFMVIIMIIIE